MKIGCIPIVRGIDLIGFEITYYDLEEGRVYFYNDISEEFTNEEKVNQILIMVKKSIKKLLSFEKEYVQNLYLKFSIFKSMTIDDVKSIASELNDLLIQSKLKDKINIILSSGYSTIEEVNDYLSVLNNESIASSIVINALDNDDIVLLDTGSFLSFYEIDVDNFISDEQKLRFIFSKRMETKQVIIKNMDINKKRAKNELLYVTMDFGFCDLSEIDKFIGINDNKY
jgi:hypothetical protein